jgi:biopolymer transport protein ExbD
MLDMAFQLLAFFILTYHPSDLEGQMQMALPSQESKAAPSKDNVNPKDAPEKEQSLDIPADLTVVVKSQNEGILSGEISALTVTTRAGAKPILPSTPEQSVTDALTRYLLHEKEAVDNKTAIKLQGDSKLKWDSVVQVMDACRKAGFDNISFVQPPDYQMSAQ